MRILATFAFAFSAAVFGAICLPLDALRVPLAIGAAICALAVAVCLKKDPRRRKRALLIFIGIALGMSWTEGYTRVFFRPAQKLDDQTVRLTAVVTDFPQPSTYDGYTVPVKLRLNAMATVSALLYGDEQYRDLRPGDRISTIAHCVVGSLTFSGEEITYYTAKGVFLRGKTYGRLDIQRPERVSPAYWPALAANSLKTGIDRSFPKDAAGVIRAVVTGNRDGLTDEFTSSLQRTGLSHTVAVSGMHLAFLANLLSHLLGKGRKITVWLTIGWAVLFCGVAGNTPSVMRAAVMIVLLQVAPLLDRQRDEATSLGLALMLLLLFNPFAAAHVGLQLSFAAVAGILLVSDRIQSWLMELFRLNVRYKNKLDKLLRKIAYFVISALSATLGATVLTAPLVAVYFGSFSLISPVSNIMTLWAVAVLFIGGLVMGALALVCAPLAMALAKPVVFLTHYVVWMAEQLSKPLFATLPLSSPYYLAWLILVYLLLLAAVAIPGGKRPVVPICAGIFALCLAALLHTQSARRADMSVAVLDVGQGQSVLVRQKDCLILVDCGGDSQPAPGDVAADYIHSLGYRRLDALVLTHCHADHAGGVEQLLDRVEVSAIVMPAVEVDAPLRTDIVALAEERGIELRLIREDTQYTWPDGRSLAIYAPVQEIGETNELGLSVLASMDGRDILLTGDMDGSAEKRLLEIAELPQVEVLIVGHHGSATSTTQALLDAVRPEMAIISVGEDNRYGHPAPATLERLETARVELYRTDRDGTVRVDMTVGG